MKVLGHPLHMMLIHFPTALLPMDVLLSFFAYYNNDNSFLPAAFYCVVAGVLVGAAAIITGIIDVLLIKKDKKPAVERRKHLSAIDVIDDNLTLHYHLFLGPLLSFFMIDNRQQHFGRL